MKDFKDISNEDQLFYFEKAKELLEVNTLLYCTRDWSAWQYKTMTDDDFLRASEDDGLVYDVAVKIYETIYARIRKEKIKNVINVS